MRRLLIEARLKITEAWVSYSRDPILSQNPGLNLILFCVTVTVAQVVPSLTYSMTSRGISLGLQLASIHFLFTAWLLIQGRDPGECGRDYFQIYGLFFLFVLVYSLPGIYFQYFGGPGRVYPIQDPWPGELG